MPNKYERKRKKELDADTTKVGAEERRKNRSRSRSKSPKNKYEIIYSYPNNDFFIIDHRENAKSTMIPMEIRSMFLQLCCCICI